MAGRFMPGNQVAKGRPPNSRAFLSSQFLKAMIEAFEELDESGTPAGLKAIRAVRNDDPGTFVRALVAIMPRELSGVDGESLLAGIRVTFVRPPPIEAKP